MEMPKFANEKLRKCILLIPILYGVMQVAVYGVNVVFWDEWEIVKLYNDILTNGFTLEKLFAQHNEHRILFPRIVLLISGVLTHWNVKIQMYISQVMVSIAYGICLLECKRFEDKDRFSGDQPKAWATTIIKLLIGFCCFSAVQHENFLWGFQVGFIMVACMAYLSFFFFQKAIEGESITEIILCAVCGGIASFSSLQGLVIWPAFVCTLGLLVITVDKRYLKKLVWIPLFGIGVVWMYVREFSFIEYHAGLKANSVWIVLKSVCAYTGNVGILSNLHISMVFGGILLLISIALILYIIVSKKVKENVFAINLIIFGYGVTTMIAIGRAGSGINMPASRYLTFSIFPYVGILLIAYKNLLGANCGIVNCARKVIWGLLAGVFACVIFANFSAIKQCSADKDERSRKQEILAHYMSYSLADLQRVYPWGNYEDAYITISLLEKNNLNVFYSNHSILPISSHVLDAMSKKTCDGPIGFDSSTLRLDEHFLSFYAPWAIDYVNKAEYQSVYVNVNGALYTTQNHVERNDVAEAFKNDNYRYSGFAFSLPRENLQVGANQISVIVVLNGGNAYYETAPVTVYNYLEGAFDDLDNLQVLGVAGSNDISELAENEEGISLIAATGYDPYIIFEPLERPVTPIAVAIEFKTLNVNGMMQLFYTDAQGEFQEEKSIVFQVSPEKTSYTLYGFGNSEVQMLRLDFANQANTLYEISSITVYYDKQI